MIAEKQRRMVEMLWHCRETRQKQYGKKAINFLTNREGGNGLPES